MSWLSLQLSSSDLFSPSDDSRAVIESDLYDEDMLTNEKYMPSFRIIQNTDGNDEPKTSITCERLFIGLPGAGNHFLRCVVDGREHVHKVAEIVLPAIDTSDRIVDPEINAAAVTELLLLSDAGTVCADVREVVHPIRCAAWARCLLQHVKAKCVHVLDSITTANYLSDKTSHEITIPMMRKLQTSAFRTAEHPLKTTKDIAALEVPNIISGLGAAIITHCELYRVPAEIVVSMEETHALEIEPIRVYEPLWAEAVGDDKRNIDFRALVRKQRPRAQNALYL